MRETPKEQVPEPDHSIKAKKHTRAVSFDTLVIGPPGSGKRQDFYTGMSDPLSGGHVRPPGQAAGVQKTAG